jgi:MinD superfamily P-loop ATPase
MKQLVILSGKGGTGKTSVAAAFAHLSAQGGPKIRAVLADADVDAANLELVLDPHLVSEEEFWSGQAATISPDSCSSCGICAEVCRFDAVLSENGIYRVDDLGCEGCAACMYACPDEAIQMEDQLAGKWFQSDTRYGPLFHAALLPAQENSGKLVTLIKQHARLFALDHDYPLVLVDGPPGIGCPVISAASGADLALIVTEPTAAGVHDMKRILETAKHFGIRSLVCINKADLHPQGSQAIEEHCLDHGLEVLSRIPFDLAVTHAMVKGEPVTAHVPDSKASHALRELWARVADALEEVA